MYNWNTGVIRFVGMMDLDGWLVQGFLGGADPIISYNEPASMTIRSVMEGSKVISLQLFRQWHDATVNVTDFGVGP